MARQRQGPLRGSAAGASPEQVLVFEVAGSVERFVRAVANTPELEWLLESDDLTFPDDEEFGSSEADGYVGRLYFVLAHAQALEQLRRLWEDWNRKLQDGTRWPRGRAPWGSVFEQLRDVRPWGARDRLLDTGFIEALNAEIAAGGRSAFEVEIELWYRATADGRADAESTVRAAVAALEGEVQQAEQIAQIHYHGMLATLPAAAIQEILTGADRGLHHLTEIMFLRPTGQFAAPVIGITELDDEHATTPAEVASLPARVAVFDGLPIEQHVLLAGRVVVDDPDGWAGAYPAPQRRHGTAIASLVCHGDLAGTPAPLRRPIYLRPVLRPNPQTRDFDADLPNETFPTDELDVVFLHRVLVETLGSEQHRGSAESIRIINLSIGNPSQLFDHLASPMARLLDWIAHDYNVLFIVSAGNHVADLDLGVTRDEIRDMEPSAIDASVVGAIWRDARLRRLLSPSESMNALTVASLHGDSTTDVLPGELSIFQTPGFPSPVNALGLGHRKSLKPDVLASGGRTPYRLRIAGPDAVIERIPSRRSPGLKHAFPGAEGALTATAYSRGTSNAAATTSNVAGHVYEVLEGAGIEDEYRTVLTKALLVHGATWPEATAAVAETLGLDMTRRKKELARFFGYGVLSPSRVLTAADERATMLGWGSLEAEESEMFEIPIPASLNGRRDWRRLTVTLAWLTPINYTHQKYRRAYLWFDMVDHSEQAVQVRRTNADWQLVRRGTLQHEVFEGERVAVFGSDRRLRIRVNAKAEAGGYEGALAYGLAVTLEVAPELQLPLYEEIAQQLALSVRVHT